MTLIKKNLYLAAIPLSVVLSILTSVRANSQTELASTQNQPFNQSFQISQTFTPPDRGTPPATAGGASRGGCRGDQKHLISLMPKEKIGLTFQERPTFFWKVANKNAKTAEFLLLDDTDDFVYETSLKLPEKQGIFSFTLPDDAPALKVNKQYHWYLTINCNLEETGDTVSVEGWIERSEPNPVLQVKLNKLEPKHRSKIYAKAGIWHDAITNVAQQRCSYPNDSNVMFNWNQLLTSVGLKKLTSESVNNVCKSAI